MREQNGSRSCNRCAPPASGGGPGGLSRSLAAHLRTLMRNNEWYYVHTYSYKSIVFFLPDSPPRRGIRHKSPLSGSVCSLSLEIKLKEDDDSPPSFTCIYIYMMDETTNIEGWTPGYLRPAPGARGLCLCSYSFVATVLFVLFQKSVRTCIYLYIRHVEILFTILWSPKPVRFSR